MQTPSGDFDFERTHTAAPDGDQVPLKDHNVKKFPAKRMQVAVPKDPVEHNKERHEEGHEPRFRYPTPVGYGHGVYNIDKNTSHFPPNYFGKHNDIDVSGGIHMDNDTGMEPDHPMESLHRRNVGVWNRAAGVRKTATYQPMASHPLTQSGSPLQNSRSLNQSRAITFQELDDPTTTHGSGAVTFNFGKPNYNRNLTAELETPYSRSIRSTPGGGASTPRGMTSASKMYSGYEPRGGQGVYRHYDQPGSKGYADQPYINSPNPLLSRQGPPSTATRELPGDAATPKPLTSKGIPRISGHVDDNPLKQRANKSWANKVGASAHLRSKGMRLDKDGGDSDSGDEELVAMRSYTRRRGYNPHTTRITTVDSLGRVIDQTTAHSHLPSSHTSRSLGGFGGGATPGGQMVPEYLKPDPPENQGLMSVHEQLYAGLEDPGSPGAASRGLGGNSAAASRVLSAPGNRQYIEVSTGHPRFTMPSPPPHPDEEAEYRLQKDHSKWHWKYEPGYEVPFQLLLARGLRPKYHLGVIDHHMVRELIQDCRRLMAGDYLVKYSRKGEMPHERWVALVMHPPRQGADPIPTLLWRQHQNSSHIVDRQALSCLVDVSFDCHSKAFKPFKVYPEGAAARARAAARAELSASNMNEDTGEQQERGSSLDDESVGTLDSLTGGPQALHIEGPIMGGSKTAKLSCGHALTLWFVDNNMTPKSVDVVTRTREKAELWVKCMRGLLAINRISVGECQTENQERLAQWCRDQLEGGTPEQEGFLAEDTDINEYMK